MPCEFDPDVVLSPQYIRPRGAHEQVADQSPSRIAAAPECLCGATPLRDLEPCLDGIFEAVRKKGSASRWRAWRAASSARRLEVLVGEGDDFEPATRT
jgi:hypothetical protein